jgi:hypothetical protein
MVESWIVETFAVGNSRNGCAIRCDSLKNGKNLQNCTWCGDHPSPATLSSWPAKALCSLNFNNLPTSIPDDLRRDLRRHMHLAFDAEFAHVQSIFNRLRWVFQKVEQPSE